ncbi:hypothetical protein BEP19_10995 [Ammoniphilus oxalaticus]|uniref:UVR domain-containing protein n=1 Tax=Ammoniphilus oxalaticus TaxID=66863 RepID=A0A419SG52_9BACL|nr:UvrB/UvrC motif-containing protein [Ammoniphilus oxalaticus]RKD22767.1 hypothetical protein BEP19_10995 [Ammoniphilus oxalaticus]
MICQECGQKPATLHFTKIVNGEKTEFRLCESCAGEKGDMFAGASPNFSIHHLLSGLLKFDAAPSVTGSDPPPAETVARCETCGLTYAQFSKSGRFGCVDCYQQFAQRLGPIFRRIHGNMQHSGKVPRRAGGVIRIRKEINDLKRQLQQSIESEEFEQAAAIRDQIKDLEKQLASP